MDLTNGTDIDFTRTVYFPLQQYATGTMSQARVTDIENYEIALIYYGSTRHLYIISVDEAEAVTESDKVIVEVG